MLKTKNGAKRTDKDRAIIRALVRIILTLEHDMNGVTCPYERVVHQHAITKQRKLLTEARRAG